MTTKTMIEMTISEWDEVPERSVDEEDEEPEMGHFIEILYEYR